MKSLQKALVMLLFSTGLLFSSENISGSSLLQDLSARGTALAGAGVALSGDVTFLKSNPAAIATIKNPQLSLFYYNGGELGTNFGSLTYGQKLGPGVLALNVSYLNGGEMELNLSGGGTQTVLSQQDVFGSLSYAFEPVKNVEFGVSAKAFASSLIGSLNGQALCGDAGVQLKNVFVENLNLGAAVLNLGPGIKYLDTLELLPTYIAGGASYSLVMEKMVFLFAVDGEVFGNSKEIIIGTEVSYEDYAVRAGLPLFSDRDVSFTMGLGYKMKEFSFDYSLAFGKMLGLSHRVSVGMLFGEIKDNKDEEQKDNPVKEKGVTDYRYKYNTQKNTNPPPVRKPGGLGKEIK